MSKTKQYVKASISRPLVINDNDGRSAYFEIKDGVMDVGGDLPMTEAAEIFLKSLTVQGMSIQIMHDLWSKVAKPKDSSLLDEEFNKAMSGRYYGVDETQDAKSWFKTGWNARVE